MFPDGQHLLGESDSLKLNSSDAIKSKLPTLKQMTELTKMPLTHSSLTKVLTDDKENDGGFKARKDYLNSLNLRETCH